MPETIYYYKRDRKQRSIIFINMGVACLAYIAGLYGYEYFFNNAVSDDFKKIYIMVFSVSSVILFYIAWWHRTHPATYEASITAENFVVNYPESTMWSFNIKVADIKRFEYRNTLSSAGQGIGKAGVLLNDGSFHEISVNYGNNIKKMYLAIKTVNPDVTFSNKVNKKVSGIITKDYDK